MNWNRFKTQKQNSQQNILSYLFFYITFMHGIGYAFFFNTAGVQATALAVIAVPPFIWGIIAMLVILSVVFTILFKWRGLAKYTGMAGFMLWIYVFIRAVIYGQWFAILIIVAPMLVFWFFWFMGINKDNGPQAKDSG